MRCSRRVSRRRMRHLSLPGTGRGDRPKVGGWGPSAQTRHREIESTRSCATSSSQRFATPGPHPPRYRAVPPPRSGEGSAPLSDPPAKLTRSRRKLTRVGEPSGAFAPLTDETRRRSRLSLPGTGRGDRPKVGGWGPQGAKRTEYRVEHTSEVAIDLVVPEPENTIALGLQPTIPLDVTRDVLVKAVVSAIELDNQVVLHAGEVDDEAVERRLTSKVIPTLLQFAQVRPELHLLWGHALAQIAGDLVGQVRVPCGPLPPRDRAVPPPRSGEGSAPLSDSPASLSMPIAVLALFAQDSAPHIEITADRDLQQRPSRLSLPGTGRGDRPKVGGWGPYPVGRRHA